LQSYPEGGKISTKQLEESDDPVSMKREMTARYRTEIANPYVAEERGFIDEVIDPAVTRLKLIRSFEALETKHVNNPARKHGNIPL
jgi:propionyl-CoA carboxylase beta chain